MEESSKQHLQNNTGSNGTSRPLSYHAAPSSTTNSSTVAQVAQTNWKFVEQLLRETKGEKFIYS